MKQYKKNESVQQPTVTENYHHPEPDFDAYYLNTLEKPDYHFPSRIPGMVDIEQPVTEMVSHEKLEKINAELPSPLFKGHVVENVSLSPVIEKIPPEIEKIPPEIEKIPPGIEKIPPEIENVPKRNLGGNTEKNNWSIGRMPQSEKGKDNIGYAHLGGSRTRLEAGLGFIHHNGPNQNIDVFSSNLAMGKLKNKDGNAKYGFSANAQMLNLDLDSFNMSSFKADAELSASKDEIVARAGLSPVSFGGKFEKQDPKSKDDYHLGLDISPGPGFDFAVHYGDKDRDGAREYGLRLGLNGVTIDGRSESWRHYPAIQSAEKAVSSWKANDKAEALSSAAKAILHLNTFSMMYGGYASARNQYQNMKKNNKK